jgi:CHAD domain-containing protein
LHDGQARLASHVEGLAQADPIAVHQARVACRRLRAVLKSFKPFVAQAPAAGYRQVLGRLAASLNDTRDLDVLAAQAELRNPRLMTMVLTEREQAVEALQRSLRRPAGRRRLALARHGPTPRRLGLVQTVETPAVLRRVRRSWRRTIGDIARAVSHPKARHALRIRLKNIRYTLEIVEDLNPEAMRLRQSLRRAQQALGDERDIAATLHWLDSRKLRSEAARRAHRRLVRHRPHLEARLPSILQGLVRAGERWDRAVTHALKTEDGATLPRTRGRVALKP